MTREEIETLLFSKKSTERRRAAKYIGKHNLVAFAEQVHEAYVKEKRDERTWETQAAMINTLGLLDHKPAKNDIEQVFRQSGELHTTAIEAATAYIRLARKSINDSQPVLELLALDNYAVLTGVSLSLAIDKMLPDREAIELILKCYWNSNKHKDRIGKEYGIMDARQYVAIACANWDVSLTADFLNHCIETAYDITSFNKPARNLTLVAVCENSLKGKYSKAYLP